MWIFPVLLDCRPAFLPRSYRGSLLLVPLGDATVLTHQLALLSAVSSAPPAIVTRFEIEPAYDEAIRRVCPNAEVVETMAAFAERLCTYDPSDQLLVADPTCFPFELKDPALAGLNEDGDPCCVRHIVALDQHGEGTREYVDADSSGRVRAILRYYESVTWPFASGVATSLVPVACLRAHSQLPLSSLSHLRHVLASEGVPSRDLPLERGAVNLGSEHGLLAMNERLVYQLVHRKRAGQEGLSSSLHVGAGATVHPSARIIGPVVLQDRAEVEEGACVIGPTVVGSDARVRARATVAQCVIGAGQTVAAGATLRHSVHLGNPDDNQEASRGTGTPGAREGWEEPTSTISDDAPRGSFYPALKRAMDATAAAMGLLLLSPLALLVAVLIKLDSKGPIHFGHLREGVGGHLFRCWKFRTMIVGADVQQRKLAGENLLDGPQFKIGEDPRRTRIGGLLAGSNLDELPQLWNVLVGQMSLVGPRPSPFRENQVCVPWRQGRLTVRPGITGLWQICRHDRDKGDFHQWIHYDLLYVQNMSFWLDMKIAALTVLSVARRGPMPLSWLLRPEKYGERRAGARAAGNVVGRRSSDRSRAAKAVAAARSTQRETSSRPLSPTADGSGTSRATQIAVTGLWQVPADTDRHGVEPRVPEVVLPGRAADHAQPGDGHDPALPSAVALAYDRPDAMFCDCTNLPAPLRQKTS